jgi:hypothetical protein
MLCGIYQDLLPNQILAGIGQQLRKKNTKNKKKQKQPGEVYNSSRV